LYFAQLQLRELEKYEKANKNKKVTTLKESFCLSGWLLSFSVKFDIMGRMWTANDSSEIEDKAAPLGSESRSGRKSLLF